MSENGNIQVIKEHFAAFGRGDVQRALEMVTEKVDWKSPVTKNQSEEISWAYPCHSKMEVMHLDLKIKKAQYCSLGKRRNSVYCYFSFGLKYASRY